MLEKDFFQRPAGAEQGRFPRFRGSVFLEQTEIAFI